MTDLPSGILILVINFTFGFGICLIGWIGHEVDSAEGSKMKILSMFITVLVMCIAVYWNQGRGNLWLYLTIFGVYALGGISCQLHSAGMRK